MPFPIYLKIQWARQDSNLRPDGYEPPALPLSYEPPGQKAEAINSLVLFYLVRTENKAQIILQSRDLFLGKEFIVYILSINFISPLV